MWSFARWRDQSRPLGWGPELEFRIDQHSENDRRLAQLPGAFEQR
jgi:hypothetical protein